MLQGSLFHSGETGHDFHFHLSVFSHRALWTLTLPPPHESFPVMAVLKAHTSRRSSLLKPAGSRQVELRPLTQEKPKSEPDRQTKWATSLLDTLHCCPCCCRALRSLHTLTGMKNKQGRQLSSAGLRAEAVVWAQVMTGLHDWFNLSLKYTDQLRGGLTLRRKHEARLCRDNKVWNGLIRNDKQKWVINRWTNTADQIF